MRLLVVYESFFGATREIAGAVAAGARRPGLDLTVEVLPVREAGRDTEGADVLLVGAPTHVLTLSTAVSRSLEAHYWGDPVRRRREHRPYGQPSHDASVRRWLRDLPATGRERHAAAFDTRVRGRGTGGAAPAIAGRLRARGYVLHAVPQGFLVASVAGPVLPGELRRAADRGSRLTE